MSRTNGSSKAASVSTSNASIAGTSAPHRAARALVVLASLGALSGCGLIPGLGRGGIFRNNRTANAQPTVIAPVADNGMMGALHREQAGRIVFSTAPIAPEAANGAALTQRVAVDDELYLRTYLRTSRGNSFRAIGVRCFNQDTRDFVAVQINGAPRNEWITLNATGGGRPRDDWDSRTTYTLGDRSMSSSPSTYPTDARQAHYLWNSSVVPRLRDGDNTLVFHATASCSGPGTGGTRTIDIAEGTLTVRVDPGRRERHLARFAPQLPTETHPEAGSLRAPILETVAREWHDEVPLRASVLSAEWQIRRSPLTGIALNRRLQAAVVVHQRTAPATLCRVFSLGFEQQSLDGRTRYSPHMTLWTGDSVEIPCPAGGASAASGGARATRSGGRGARR